VILRVLQVGKTKEGWLKEGISEYMKRLAPMMRLRGRIKPTGGSKTPAAPTPGKPGKAALSLNALHRKISWS